MTMRLIYQDVETGAEMADPEAGTYSVMELLAEHRQRYVLRTSAGVVIMRHLPLRMKRIIDAVSTQLYPSRAELVARLDELRPYIEGVPADSIDPAKVAEIQAIAGQLRITDMYALGVIVAPCVATMDDVETLYESLDEGERISLDLCIAALESIRPDGQVDWSAMEIAKANGLTLISEEMLQAMTVSQASVLLGRIAAENRRINRMMGIREVK